MTIDSHKEVHKGKTSSEMNKLLVIEAHSDDSAIGAYGLIQKMKFQWYKPYFFVCAASDFSMHHSGLVSRATRLKEYADYVKMMDGTLVESRSPMDAEARLDMVPMSMLVSTIEAAIMEVRPQVLICQAPSFHQDHEIVYKATIAAIRPTARFHPDEVLLMENSTYYHSSGPSTDFRPSTYCCMTEEEMQAKIDCFMSCFPSQIRGRENCLSPEGIKAWAKYRAIECNYPFYAEAFVPFIRRI